LFSRSVSISKIWLITKDAPIKSEEIKKTSVILKEVRLSFNNKIVENAGKNKTGRKKKK
jgi:hypothetical protein